MIRRATCERERTGGLRRPRPDARRQRGTRRHPATGSTSESPVHENRSPVTRGNQDVQRPKGDHPPHRLFTCLPAPEVGGYGGRANELLSRAKTARGASPLRGARGGSHGGRGGGSEGGGDTDRHCRGQVVPRHWPGGRPCPSASASSVDTRPGCSPIVCSDRLMMAIVRGMPSKRRSRAWARMMSR